MTISISKDDLVVKLAKVVKSFFKEDTPIMELVRFVHCCEEEFELSAAQRKHLTEIIVEETGR